MNYEDKGEIAITSANDMNVPVNSFLTGPDKNCPKWRWTADNFMPRKGNCGEGMYEVEADDRETLLELVKQYVVPLYRAALGNLETVGANYYWEPKPQFEKPHRHIDMSEENQSNSKTDSITDGDCHPAPCSALVLVKRCPDGKQVSLRFPDETELRTHLLSMWRYTSGYSIVAVYLVPND